jgi:hypothetical protein
MQMTDIIELYDHIPFGKVDARLHDARLDACPVLNGSTGTGLSVRFGDADKGVGKLPSNDENCSVAFSPN